MKFKRKLMLLALCLIWSCTAISQTLEPIPQTINGSKYFCFTIAQSKFIAKKFEYSIYQDSLIKLFEIDITRYKQLTREKDFIIFGLETKIDNLNTVQNNDELHIEQLNKTIRKKDKQLKQGRFVKWLLGTGLAVVTGILILK